MQLRRAGTFDSRDLVVCVGSHRFGRNIMGCGQKKQGVSASLQLCVLMMCVAFAGYVVISC